MPVTLPVEVYQTFEERFGKDGAHKLVKSFEAMISDVTEYKWAVTREELFRRLASKDEISRLAAEQSRLATKEELNRLSSEINKLTAEVSKLIRKDESRSTKEDGRALRGTTDEFKPDIPPYRFRFEDTCDKVDRHFTIGCVIIILTSILVNWNTVEFLIDTLRNLK